MLDTDTLFLKTLEDIERRMTLNEPYELLLIAGLLRKLLMDDHPLIDQVNKTRKQKIIFEVGVSRPLPEGLTAPAFWTQQDGFDPDTAPPFVQRKQASRDEFLKAVVIRAGTHEYTVRDVIAFEANVAGAVHAGAAKTEKEVALKEVEKMFAVGGHASALRQLLAIARVTLKALNPLRGAIHAS